MGGPKNGDRRRTRNRSSTVGRRSTPRSNHPAHHAPDIREVLDLLKSRFRVDLSQYKANTIRRRVERQMALDRIDGMKAYAAWLGAHHAALDRCTMRCS